MTLDDLPADVKAEAEALAVELGADVEALGKFWAEVNHRALLRARLSRLYPVRFAEFWL